jgi:hypothetical protein
MNDLKSFLPPVEDVRNVQVMQIHQLAVNDFPWKRLQTKFNIVDKLGKSKRISAMVYRLDDEATRGYLPTKMWYHDGSFRMLYYVSPALPMQARPFKDKPCYMFAIYPKVNEIIEYEASVRVFIDQVQNNTIGLGYIFMFGEDDARDILATDWDGNEWGRPESAQQIIDDPSGLWTSSAITG